MSELQKEQIISTMKDLIEKINKASYEYYVLDNPTISDKEWDALYYKLLDLEKETGIILENSPSKKIGGDVLDKFQKVTHKEKLFSLGKAQNISEIEDWCTRNQNIISFEEEFSVEYKFDGLSQHIAFVIYSNTDVKLLTVFTNLSMVAVYSVYNLVTSAIKKIMFIYIIYIIIKLKTYAI